MRLHEYLWKEKRTLADFCRSKQLPYQTLCAVMNGRRNIRLDLALRLLKATEGEVTLKEMLPKK